MALTYRERAILAKEEATYGVSSVPAAADALLCSNLEIRPLEGEYRDRELVIGQLGLQPEQLLNVHSAVSFGIEAGGSGAAGTPPSWSDVLLACGYAETVTPGTSVAYNLVSSDYSSATIRTHMGGADGHRQDLLGCRGRVGFTANANDLPRFTAELRGVFSAPIKEAPFATDTTAHQIPPRIEPPNVTAFTLGGQEVCFTQFSIEDARTIQVNRYANCAEVSPGNDRAITGRVQIEMPALDAKDLIAEARAGTLQALQMVYGTVAGNIMTIDAPRVQLKLDGYQDNQGDLNATLLLNFTPDQGDDELSFTVT